MASLKFLEVLIDSQLNWQDHIYHVLRKISKGIYIIRRLQGNVKEEILIR
jgi:hypothetical protein